MVIKFPLATMLDFLQEQLTVILRYSPRQKSFYPNDGILGERFFLISVSLDCSCQKHLWQIMQAELLFSNETYKLCIFVNLSNKKKPRDWTERLKYIFTRLTSRALYFAVWARGIRGPLVLWRTCFSCIIGDFLKHLKIFDNTDFSLILFNTALVLLKEVSCTFTKKKLHNALARGLENRGRGTGEEKVGDASPKRVGSERNKRKLRSIANYFVMKMPKKKESGARTAMYRRWEACPPCSVSISYFINSNCTNSIQHTNGLSAFVFIVTSLTRTAYGRLAQVPGCALDINSYIRLSRSVNTLEYLS